MLVIKTHHSVFTLVILLLAGFLQIGCAQQQPVKFQCLPCGLACDQEVFGKPGECPHCHMKLVDASTITFKTVEPTSICSYMKSHPKAILLDVRTPEEYKGEADPDFGSLKNATNIPIQELEVSLEKLKAYKDKEILVYCSHSHRSSRVSYLLTQNGFTHVSNLLGGMSEVKDKECIK